MIAKPQLYHIGNARENIWRYTDSQSRISRCVLCLFLIGSWYAYDFLLWMQDLLPEHLFRECLQAADYHSNNSHLGLNNSVLYLCLPYEQRYLLYISPWYLIPARGVSLSIGNRILLIYPLIISFYPLSIPRQGFVLSMQFI